MQGRAGSAGDGEVSAKSWQERWQIKIKCYECGTEYEILRPATSTYLINGKMRRVVFDFHEKCPKPKCRIQLVR